MWKVRIVGDFPEEAVGVGEVAGVAAPECGVAGFHDFGAELGDVRQQGIDLGGGADVVGEGEAGESRALGRQACVFRQVLPRPQGEPGFSEFEERDRWRGFESGQAEALFVETRGSREIRDTEGDETDSGLHAVAFGAWI